MSMNYEWDVELIITYDENTNDVEEHYFQDTYADCLKQAAEPLEDGYSYEIVLVATSDDGDERWWAYIEDGKLPEFFEDAYQRKMRKIPQRFHEEVNAKEPA